MIEPIDDGRLKNDNRYHVCLDDVPGKTPDEMKEFFDYVPRKVIIPKINSIIEELENKADNENVFCKQEVTDMISEYAKSEDVYIRSKTDELLADKQNVGDCYEKSDVDGMLGNILKGKKSGRYLAIDDISPNSRSVGIKLRSKNVVDIEQVGLSTTASYEHTEDGIIIEGDGHAAFCADLKKGETYVFTCKSEQVYGDCGLVGKWGVEYTGEVMSELADYGTPMTLTSDAVAVCVYLNIGDGTGGCAKFTEVMLEKGSAASQYTPYVSELNTVAVKAGGKNHLDISKWNYTSVVDYNGVPCLKTIETGNHYFEIDAPRDTAFTFTCRVFREAGSETKISNLKAKRDGVERHIVGKQIHGETVTGTVYGGERIYFIGWNSYLYIELSSLTLKLESADGEYEDFKGVSTVYADESGDLALDYSGGGLSVIVCDDGVIADVSYSRDVNKAIEQLGKGSEK